MMETAFVDVDRKKINKMVKKIEGLYNQDLPGEKYKEWLKDFYMITGDSYDENILTLNDVPYKIENSDGYIDDGKHRLVVSFDLKCGISSLIEVEISEEDRQLIAQEYLEEKGVIR